MADEDLIVVNSLAKRYNGHTAVRGVTFTLRTGEVFGLRGLNGAGKTTTINMLSCLLEPTASDARIAGHSVRTEPMAVRRVIGIVPQEIALYPTLTVRENLPFWARMYEVHAEVADRRVEEVLDVVGLRDRAAERIDTYSGRRKRRVNIAVGLLHRPRLLMLDEPMVGVDPQPPKKSWNQ